MDPICRRLKPNESRASVTLLADFISQPLDNIDTALYVKGWTGNTRSIVRTTDLAELRIFAAGASWAAGTLPCFEAMLEQIWSVIDGVCSTWATPAQSSHSTLSNRLGVCLDGLGTPAACGCPPPLLPGGLVFRRAGVCDHGRIFNMSDRWIL